MMILYEVMYYSVNSYNDLLLYKYGKIFVIVNNNLIIKKIL